MTREQAEYLAGAPGDFVAYATRLTPEAWEELVRQLMEHPYPSAPGDTSIGVSIGVSYL